MYLGKKHITALNDVLFRLNIDIRLAGIVGVKRQLKELYFLVDEVKDKAVSHRNKSLAHQKETRFGKPHAATRFCCVCRYRLPEKDMRRLTAYESGVQRFGRADQWICLGSHRTPHKIAENSKLGRPVK